MKKMLGLIVMVFGLSGSVSAQLPNGSIAPDFNLTDLNGNSHHLYNYLEQGKVVFIKFFACHCPSCWAYHNTGKLESLYQSYGPAGTDQVVILMIEYDEGNGYNEFHGISGFTQGDWVIGTSSPIINAEGADRSVFTNYNMTYYPMIYKICPDQTTELMSTSLTVADLYQAADDCPGTLAIDENSGVENLFIDHVNHQLILDNFEGLDAVQIINSAGQQMLREVEVEGKTIDISALSNGVYFVKVEYAQGTLVRKIYLP